MTPSTDTRVSAGFTPGPWRHEPAEPPSIVDADGETVVDLPLWIPEFRAERDANARLIAAAPELYAKVEIAATIFEEYARLHLAKGTADGNAKAERNMQYALEMRAALTKARAASS